MCYGDLQVFKDVNLAVGEREVLALVGPSGCGKTTLLRCLDGLIPVSEGEVFIEGEQVTAPKVGVAMVFQHFGLFPWKTVYQNSRARRVRAPLSIPGFRRHAAALWFSPRAGG